MNDVIKKLVISGTLWCFVTRAIPNTFRVFQEAIKIRTNMHISVFCHE